jgi:hypothetical protein
MASGYEDWQLWDLETLEALEALAERTSVRRRPDVNVASGRADAAGHFDVQAVGDGEDQSKLPIVSSTFLLPSSSFL